MRGGRERTSLGQRAFTEETPGLLRDSPASPGSPSARTGPCGLWLLPALSWDLRTCIAQKPTPRGAGGTESQQESLPAGRRVERGRDSAIVEGPWAFGRGAMEGSGQEAPPFLSHSHEGRRRVKPLAYEVLTPAESECLLSTYYAPAVRVGCAVNPAHQLQRRYFHC